VVGDRPTRRPCAEQATLPSNLGFVLHLPAVAITLPDSSEEAFGGLLDHAD
jgi:hypothetical protein